MANDDFNEIQRKQVFSKKDSIIGSVMKGIVENGQEFTVVDYDFSKPKNKWTIKVGDKRYVCPSTSLIAAKVIKKASFADMVIK